MMKFNQPIKVAKVCNKKDEIDVENGLAMTPAQIASATARGRAVSLSSLENMAYFDMQEDNISPSAFPMDYIRGIDDNQCWAASQDSSEKIRKFKQHIAHREKNVLPS